MRLKSLISLTAKTGAEHNELKRWLFESESLLQDMRQDFQYMKSQEQDLSEKS